MNESGRIKREVQRPGMPLPEAGRIKIGIKVAGTNAAGKAYERPSSIDYFRATGTFAEQFHKVMGPKPDKITIVFISDNLTDSCNEEYACWENGKRWGWGDGENYQIWDSKEKEYVAAKADDERVKAKKWDVMLTMRFVIPEINGVLGHWVFTTKGAKTTIPSLVQSFDFIKERAGTVIGVPFELVVEKVKGYSPTDPKQYSKVKLIPCFSEDYLIKLKNFLSAGKTLAELAPIMVSEAKLLAASNNNSSAPVIDVVAEEVKDEEEALPMQLLFDIENAQTRDNLSAIHKEAGTYHMNEKYKAAMSKKSEEIKKQQK